MSTKQLLIVCNTPSENTTRLAQATLNGAQHGDIENTVAVLKTPLEANSEDVLSADGIIIGTTENFGAMSGLIKDFFERIYYPCLETKQGTPYCLYVRAGLDGSATIIGVQKILTGLRWKAVQEPLLLHGEYQTAFEQQCSDLGLLLAAGLDNGVY